LINSSFKESILQPGISGIVYRCSAPNIPYLGIYMLGLVIPLKSQKTSSNWGHVCQLLERTLRSILNQTSNHYKVLVVCNEIPELNISNDKIQYVLADFKSRSANGKIEGYLDRAQKTWLGLNAFKEDVNISHVMLLDADDCISASLVQYVTENKICNGWFIKSGFEYPDGGKIVYVRDRDMHHRTSSSFIVKRELLNKYADLPLELVDAKFLFHQNILDTLENDEVFLQPFPFPGVVYIVDHGDNLYTNRKMRFLSVRSPMDFIRIYGGAIKRKFIARPLSDKIRSEFSLDLEN
jgi:hypothetical protein